MNGKGSTSRPIANREDFRRRWDETFCNHFWDEGEKYSVCHKCHCTKKGARNKYEKDGSCLAADIPWTASGFDCDAVISPPYDR